MQVTNKEELLADLVVKVDNKIQPVFKEIQEKALFNQGKVLEAFRKHRVSDYHLILVQAMAMMTTAAIRSRKSMQRFFRLKPLWSGRKSFPEHTLFRLRSSESCVPAMN